MWELLLVSALLVSKPEPPPVACGLVALLKYSEKEIDFSDSGTSCLFALRYELSSTGEFIITGEHWVVKIQIPKGADPHWIAYQWRSQSATYNGEQLQVVQYYKHEI